MKWVVDASVAMKWVIDESGSDDARVFLDNELAAPDLIFNECANVLWKKQIRGEISAGLSQAAATALTDAPIEIYPSKTLTTRALQLAVQLNHPAYDCFYLVLANQLGATLVTADRRLHTRCQQADAQSLSLRIHLLGSPLPQPKVH